MAVIFCRERKKVCNEISARVSALFLLLRSLLEYPVFTSGMGRIQPYFDCVRAKAVSIQTDIENCTKRKVQSE